MMSWLMKYNTIYFVVDFNLVRHDCNDYDRKNITDASLISGIIFELEHEQSSNVIQCSRGTDLNKLVTNYKNENTFPVLLSLLL